MGPVFTVDYTAYIMGLTQWEKENYYQLFLQTEESDNLRQILRLDKDDYYIWLRQKTYREIRQYQYTLLEIPANSTNPITIMRWKNEMIGVLVQQGDMESPWKKIKDLKYNTASSEDETEKSEAESDLDPVKTEPEKPEVAQ